MYHFKGSGSQGLKHTSPNEGDASCEDEDGYEEQDEIELDAEEEEVEKSGELSSGIRSNPEMLNAPVLITGSGLPWILELCLRNLGCQSVGSGGTTKCMKFIYQLFKDFDYLLFHKLAYLTPHP